MNSFCREELEFIRKRDGGFLNPHRVVEFARNPDTELNKYFEWNNDEAAEKYRLAQARALIRVAVVVSVNTNEKVRAYVSLSSDRNDAGGYRAFAEVITDEILMETMLQDALNELAAFQRKYDKLKAVSELNPVFTAIEQAVPKTQSEDRVSA